MKIEFPAKAAILLSGMLALTAAQAKDPVHSCPVKSTIKQMQKSDGRIEYQAKDSRATWQGESISGNLSDLASVRFLEAYLIEGDTRAVCDYVNEAVGIRMSLKLKSPAVPITGWKAEKQPGNGAAYPRCKNEPQDCKFRASSELRVANKT
ncbi:hypothetical protein ABQZ99_002890 [Xanthomonas hortorum pv. vitians]|uniref:DUF3757 domain-containing protein n=1 Tax=Xanthomonas hortorum pv. vitians TaxID=83224 RepID=A0A6V7BD46_9XANT|nr:DUF3757 domain-containing protein [Xanthomonas hortorum]MCC8496062.1 DUF3757 domain-containing protein [Xanthomonas hortorum pv. gardneri]MCE4299386.1 DUF3757 domain-containing protein [Xanthomonas hortorum pv. vitians]MCE4302169.1 DUF3757 domain-containing protein [Xanthomonas hortorum pv. vitians]MCE4306876.1 DUF3757 domain-containing protein [Xanthomonas hortorum pv. vitians]MCE4336939.1 DUF3757 domain-containing protein [Xanthomonas hortorum pv. vitians]